MSYEREFVQKIMSIITSDATKKIDFVIGGTAINYPQFLRVFSALITGDIGVQFKRLPPGVAAQYVSEINKYRFSSTLYGASIREMRAILHESVHAILDIRGGAMLHGVGGVRFFTFTGDEAAAFVAGALYGNYCGLSLESESGNPLFAKAAEVANKIITRRNIIVSEADESELRRLVVETNAYRSMNIRLYTPSTSDGLYSDD